MSLSATTNHTEAAEAARIHPAGPADRSDLLAMYRSFEPRPASLGLPPRQQLEEWLDRVVPAFNLLAFVAGNLAGHGVLCPDGAAAEVAVFVHQNYRNRGIGRLLLEALIAEARRLGMRRVWGMTELDNLPMLRLARAVGFAQEKDPCMFAMDLGSASQVRER